MRTTIHHNPCCSKSRETLALLNDPEFQERDYTIKWLEQWLTKQED